MFPLKNTHKRLDLCFDKTFILYDIQGYQFDENLEFFKNQDGVYIFTEYNLMKPNWKKFHIDIIHKMLYCGKTVDLRDRFDSHHHRKELIQHKHLYIAVAYCDTEDEITKLEKQLLEYYNFPVNDEKHGHNTGAVSPLTRVVKI